jgi:hypothetical protein
MEACEAVMRERVMNEFMPNVNAEGNCRPVRLGQNIACNCIANSGTILGTNGSRFLYLFLLRCAVCFCL